MLSPAIPASGLPFMDGDPHPIGYLRVLVGVQSCRYFYGSGPWDALELAWSSLHPLQRAPAETRAIIQTRCRCSRRWFG